MSNRRAPGSTFLLTPGFSAVPHEPRTSPARAPHESGTTPSTSSPAAARISLADHTLISPTKHRPLQRLPLLPGQEWVGGQGRKLGCGCQQRCSHPRNRRAPQYVYGTPSASGMIEKSSEAGTASKSETSSPKYASNASRTVFVASPSLFVRG